MVEFTDNSAKVKDALAKAMTAAMYEIGGELVARTVRNSDTRTDTGQTKGSYAYRVVSGNDEVTVYVGSDLENAIWEEFGTGEYALNGDGRKGGWVYKSDKDGKFYHTYGKTPNRPLYRAFTSFRNGIEEAINRRLRDL